jgi:alcohol dehydrogenase class IV
MCVPAYCCAAVVQAVASLHVDIAEAMGLHDSQHSTSVHPTPVQTLIEPRACLCLVSTFLQAVPSLYVDIAEAMGLRVARPDDAPSAVLAAIRSMSQDVGIPRNLKELVSRVYGLEGLGFFWLL